MWNPSLFKPGPAAQPSPGISLHCRLVNAFTGMVQSYANPTAAVRADVLCCFEVIATTRRTVARHYAWLTAASARSGALKPEQVFVLADEVGREEAQGLAGANAADRFSGLLLDLSCLPHVRSLKTYLPAPEDAVTAGRLHMCLSDTFAHHLLSSFDETEPPLLPGEVVVNKLLFRDRTPRRVCVAGIDPDFARIRISAVGADARVDEQEHEENGNADEAARALQEPAASSDPFADGFDFMSLLDQDSQDASDPATESGGPDGPQAKRRRTQAPSARAPAAKPTQPEPADDADAPCSSVAHELEPRPVQSIFVHPPVPSRGPIAVTYL